MSEPVLVCKCFGLSQDQRAAYLIITCSLLNMAEKEERYLPDTSPQPNRPADQGLKICARCQARLAGSG